MSDREIAFRLQVLSFSLQLTSTEDPPCNISYNFNYMHPGDYYINAIYDSNGDFNYSSGDYMNLNFDVPFSLGATGNSSPAVDINFQIP